MRFIALRKTYQGFIDIFAKTDNLEQLTHFGW
jgi:hypothetical protein